MAEDSLPTAEEFALLREAYAETYPVRPLLNAIAAKDAEIEQLRAVAAAARRLVETAHDSINHDGRDTTTVDEPALTALESALEAAGYGMTDEEAAELEKSDG